MSSALELRQVSKVYGSGPTEVRALRDVDLSVDRGELVAIMGPSGSGKSTLLTIAGSLEQPTNGQVLVDGVDLAGISRSDQARMRRRSIGYVFQDFNLLAGLTAVENVTLPLELDGIGAKAARAAGIAAMEQLDVADHADRYAEELSGGERQRVAITRAIVGERGLLLARRAHRRSRLGERRGSHAPAARRDAAGGRRYRRDPRGAAGFVGRSRRLPARWPCRRPDGRAARPGVAPGGPLSGDDGACSPLHAAKAGEWRRCGPSRGRPVGLAHVPPRVAPADPGDRSPHRRVRGRDRQRDDRLQLGFRRRRR